VDRPLLKRTFSKGPTTAPTVDKREKVDGAVPAPAGTDMVALAKIAIITNVRISTEIVTDTEALITEGNFCLIF
jgi:hypothetical protein